MRLTAKHSGSRNWTVTDELGREVTVEHISIDRQTMDRGVREIFAYGATGRGIVVDRYLPWLAYCQPEDADGAAGRIEIDTPIELAVLRDGEWVRRA